jgi:Carboxypeptidase regulatory-like domain
VVAASLFSALALTTGLHGVVMRGPTMPVCIAAKPCSAPAKHLRVTFLRDGRSYRTWTDSRGTYRIALAPGRYTIRVPNNRFGVEPASVVVPAGRFARQNLYIDTGIR